MLVEKLSTLRVFICIVVVVVVVVDIGQNGARRFFLKFRICLYIVLLLLEFYFLIQ